jgi:serine protease Do
MKTPSFVWIWIVAAVIGAAAGGLTASFTTGSIRGDIQSVIDHALPNPAQAPATATTDAWRKASPAVALLFAPKAGPFVERPEDALAHGIALTSDGWILVAAPAGTDVSKLTVSVGGQAYPVDRVMSDPASGLTFVKVSAGNLPVEAFASGGELPAGTSAWVLPAADRVLPTVVTGIDAGADPAVSSEAIRTRYVLDRVAVKAQPGSPLVNDRGELVGIVDASTDEPRAVPLPFILPAFSSLLKSGAIARPVVGLVTVDLAHARRLDPSFAHGQDRGALVYGAGGVKPGTPAAKAGMRTGDIILEVDGSPIDATQSFADAIAPFALGETHVLTIDRAGERRAVSLQL